MRVASWQLDGRFQVLFMSQKSHCVIQILHPKTPDPMAAGRPRPAVSMAAPQSGPVIRGGHGPMWGLPVPFGIVGDVVMRYRDGEIHMSTCL